MMQKKPLIIGNFGYRTNKLDGQTVKTRSITNLFINHSKQKPILIDTSYKVNILKILWSIKPNTIIIFIGGKANFALAFPFIYFNSKISGCSILYFHIGSFLVEFLQQFPLYKFFIENIRINFTETVKMNSEILSITSKGNYKVLPNFRITDHIPKFNPIEETIKLVFFARILKEKGVDLIFEMHEILIDYFNSSQIKLDFYGPILDSQLNFEKKISKQFGVTYKGIIEPTNAYNILERYDILVFPTYFKEEGYPGTILDAFISGIPIIASDWKYNNELIHHNINGLLFENKNAKDLANKVELLINNRALLSKMKKNAVAKGESIISTNYWDEINPYLS